jgi:hypothetical protein
MTEDMRAESLDLGHETIERRDTGLRILLTLLFVVVAALLDSLLGVIVVFQLLWALITRRPPAQPLQDFANRVISYYYALGRYLTYNDSGVPFPFSEFPQALQPSAWDGAERESDALGLSQWDEVEHPDDDERGGR